MKIDPSSLKLALDIILGVFAILAALFTAWARFRNWVMSFFKPKASPGNILVPKKSLILIPSSKLGDCCWVEATIGDKPAMHIRGHFKVTNISEYQIQAVELRTKTKSEHSMVLMRDPDSNVYGRYMVPVHGLSEISFNYFIVPPTKKKGEPIFESVAVVDQFGNEHWVKKIEFISL